MKTIAIPTFLIAGTAVGGNNPKVRVTLAPDSSLHTGRVEFGLWPNPRRHVERDWLFARRIMFPVIIAPVNSSVDPGIIMKFRSGSRGKVIGRCLNDRDKLEFR
jgi:hypothetical protein